MLNFKNRLLGMIHTIPRIVWLIVLMSLLVHVGGLMWILSHVGYDALIWGDALGYMDLAQNLDSGQ